MEMVIAAPPFPLPLPSVPVAAVGIRVVPAGRVVVDTPPLPEISGVLDALPDLTE